MLANLEKTCWRTYSVAKHTNIRAALYIYIQVYQHWSTCVSICTPHIYIYMLYVNYIHTCLYHVNVHVLYVSYFFYCAKVCLSSTVVRCSSRGTWRFANIFKLCSPKGYKSERKEQVCTFAYLCVLSNRSIYFETKNQRLLLSRNYPFIIIYPFFMG